MRLTKTLAWSFAFFFFIYVLYVAAVAIFLNTPLFSQVAGMEDEAQTYVRFKGAVSLYPGHLYVPSGRVFIGDQNVSIGIDVTDIQAHFKLKPLLQKRLEVTSLVIDKAEVEVGLKTTKETDAYARKYVTPDSLDLKKRIELAEQRSRSRLTLDFRSITIRRITHVRGGFGKLEGEMALQGGFLIQPKVQVEVYPTTLQFLSGIVGRADVKIDRFRTVDAPGNAVFPYVQANFDFNINTQALHRMDYRLDVLPGYSLDQDGSNVAVNVRIVKGVLQKGSTIESAKTRVVIRTPSLDATGTGKLKWEVDAQETSRLKVNVGNLHLLDKTARATDKGRVRSASMDIRLYGNRLIAAFNGLSMLLKIDGLDWRLKSDFEQNPNFAYEGRLTGGGTIGAFTGDIPARAKQNPRINTQLNLVIPELKIKTSFAKEIIGKGSLQLTARPLDLASSNALYPEIRNTLDLQVGNHGTIHTRAILSQLEHQLLPLESWKGKLHWTIDDTKPLVEAIQELNLLNGNVQSLAKVKNLQLDADLDLNNDGSVIRFKQIKSDAAWKGYGTLRNAADGMHGLFELSVLTLPVGVWITPEHTDVQFMPGQDWYDRTLQSPPITSARSPKASGAQGKQ